MPVERSALGNLAMIAECRQMHPIVNVERFLGGRAWQLLSPQSLLRDDVPRLLPCGSEREGRAGSEIEAFAALGGPDYEVEGFGGLLHPYREAGYGVIGVFVAANPD